jgi:hypothetical protein
MNELRLQEIDMTALEDTTNETFDTQQNITGNFIAKDEILNTSKSQKTEEVFANLYKIFEHKSNTDRQTGCQN